MLFSMLGILVTYKCNAMCESCGPRCGPHRKESLTVDEIKRIIDEATECGSRVICFTGGEPTLLGPNLEKVIAYATEKDNKTRLVSNGWWAKDPQSARKRMKSFMDAGLTELDISADDWHLPYVPLERVAFAVDAAYDLGMKMIIAVGETIGSKVSADYLHEYLPGNPPVHNDVDSLRDTQVAIRRSWILPFGYASEKIAEEEFYSFALKKDAEVEYVKSQGCPMVLTSPAILPDGRVTGCCAVFNEDNDSLVMGYWPQQSLREILEGGEQDLLLNWIKLEGPFGIKDYIEKHAPEIGFKPGYAGMCHLCGELLEREETRKFLEAHIHELRDHILMLKLKRISGLERPIGCIESRMAQQYEANLLRQREFRKPPQKPSEPPLSLTQITPRTQIRQGLS